MERKGEIIWDGSVEVFATNTSGEVTLSSTGLDSISITEPSGRATTFREMVLQTWMRFFNKVERTSTQIKVYDAGGASAITTQEHSNASNIVTVDEA